MSLLKDFKKYASHEWRGMKPGLERVEMACEKLGHPERKFPSLHIAGSNGKGSVAAMLHSILSQGGYKVGLFTSPHLVRVNERFRVGDEEITDGELEEILEKISQKIPLPFARGGLGRGRTAHNAQLDVLPPLNPLLAKEGRGEGLTFFELCTLIAFLYFAEKKVDIAILEVGLGGRLDATNVITPRVSIITEISLEHTEILGPDLKSIAREKAGIIKPNVPVVCGVTAEETRGMIEEVAREKGSEIIWAGRQEGRESRFDWGAYQDLEIGLEGLHQFHNAAIALTTIEVLRGVGASANNSWRMPLQVDENSIRRGLKNVRWPGRMEWVSRDPPILFDGAHNPAGMRALVEFLRSQEKKRIRWKILFSAAKEKDVAEMLTILQEIGDEIAICRMDNARSIDPFLFTLSLGRGQGEGSVQVSKERNAFETYQKMVKELKADEGLLVTGSLFLVGELKRGLGRPTIS